MRGKTTEDCVFCRIVRSDPTPDVLAHRDDLTAVFPCRHQQPGNRGHVLVVPADHVAQIYGVRGELAAALMTTLARVAAAVKEIGAADGVTIRQNNEPHGGQDVFHVHFHVIPRYAGDGFDTGDDRYPHGAVEVPRPERIEQARALAGALRRHPAKETP